jgi:hypothetical protein
MEDFLFVLSEGDLPYSGGTQRPIFRAQRPAVEAVGTSVPPRTRYETKNPGTAKLLSEKKYSQYDLFFNNIRFYRNI